MYNTCTGVLVNCVTPSYTPSSLYDFWYIWSKDTFSKFNRVHIEKEVGGGVPFDHFYLLGELERGIRNFNFLSFEPRPKFIRPSFP